MATTASETATQKGKAAGEQNKPDPPRVKTVTPDNENGDPGPPKSKDYTDAKTKSSKSA